MGYGEGANCFQLAQIIRYFSLSVGAPVPVTLRLSLTESETDQFL
jgi:hypothetical protein